MGTTREDVDAFCARLTRAFADFRKRAEKQAKRAASGNAGASELVNDAE